MYSYDFTEIEYYTRGNKVDLLSVALNNLKSEIGEELFVQSLNSGRTTLLMEAAEFCSIDTARLLISMGADVNQQSEDDGNTALMSLARHRSLDDESMAIDFLNLMLGQGADRNLINNFGQTASQIAELNHYRELSEALTPVYQSMRP